MDRSEFTLREIELHECDAFFEIEKACFSDPWARADFEYQITSPNGKIIGAFQGEKPVGFVNVQYIVGELTVNNIAVMPEYRGQGLGGRLLEYAFEAYPETEVALLEVRKSNIPAQKLYKKYGFEKVGERKNYYSNPTEDAILMTKKMGDKNELY